MSAKFIAVTKPHINNLSPDEFIAYVARISNPSNQNNTETAPKLIKYLLKNKHFSPFEMVNAVCEINTTRDIGRQILRHRSFSFQEFSQRYADPLDLGFLTREARLQDTKNRQNSIEIEDDNLQKAWFAKQQQIIHESKLAYKWAIENGIAKEQARSILPEGLTQSRLYMNGSLRSYIHFIQVRFHPAAQKEIRQIAEEIYEEVIHHFPSVEEYLQEVKANNFRS